MSKGRDQEAIFQGVNHASLEPAQEKIEGLRERVEAAIAEAITKVKPGTRLGDHIFSDHGVKVGDMMVGGIIKESLERSLTQKDSLTTVAQKVALLHSFPREVGGGGYTNMTGVPELRKKILVRMLEELPRFSTDAREDENFGYLFDRILSRWTDDDEVERQNLGHIPKGNQLTKAIVEFTLNRMS